jgi:spore maturation protein CgeB
MVKGQRRQARVLFVGYEMVGSNATSLRNAILRRGHDCLTVDSRLESYQMRAARRAGASHVAAKLRQLWNDELVRAARAWRPDIVVVFKGVDVTLDTLAACPGILVHYHPDDSSNDANRSAAYAKAEAAYDLHVTTKTHNVAELTARGARSVLLLPCAYDRDWHVPVRRPTVPKFAAGFIGSRRPDRVELIKHVASRWKRKFCVCGSDWRRDPLLRLSATVSGPQLGLALSIAVAEAPIQLGLLNSANRDQHTCRSYEVPAAGGVLVAERTGEHARLLEEGKEALFFSSRQELEGHLERLIAEPATATRMSAAACRRIRAGGNTYEDRWDTILEAAQGRACA